MGALKSYLALARRLSPRELGDTLIRRGSRKVQERWYRRGRPLTEAELRRAHHAVDESQLISAALEPTRFALWCHLDRREGLRRLLRSQPEARARALARADRALARQVTVFERKVTFGPGPIDWDLDVVLGERFLVGQPAPSGADLKYPWALGRLEGALALGQGYWAADEAGDAQRRSAYAQEFVDSVADFLRTHPMPSGVQWKSPMEVALRAVNLAQALHLFADAPQLSAPGFFTAVLRSIAEHLRFVEAHLEDSGAVPNNHLLSGLVGLVVVGALLPKLPGARRRAKRAAGRLSAEMMAQVHPDGMSFEGSVPYHRLSLELFLLAALTAPGAGLELGAGYRERLHRMFRCSAGYVTQAGLAPQIGDNDSGRALALAERRSLDHGYLAPLGAALFGDPLLKQGDAELPDEALWLLGESGAERFSRLAAHAEQGDWWSTAAGLYLLRNGEWEVAVCAGRQGQRGVGGHSHNDKLSFELHVGGNPVVVDPGTPTYTRDPMLRNRYRGTAMHNTPQVDGQEQAPLNPDRLFALPEGAYASVHAHSEGRLIASHRGYQRLPGKVALRRLFDLGNLSVRPEGGLRPGLWPGLLIEDRFEGTGNHDLWWPIHFAPVEAALEGQSVRVQPLGAPALELDLPADLEARIEPYLYSPGYGELVEAPRLLLRWRGALPARFVFRFQLHNAR